MNKAMLLAAIAAAALAGPVAAQAPAAPQAGAQATAGAPAVPAPQSLEEFRKLAMASDAFEIESSRLAMERSKNDEVRRYAERMIRDHGMTTQALMGGEQNMANLQLGASAGTARGGATAQAPAAQAPAATGSVAAPQLDARKAEMLSKLQAAQGEEFDRLYGQMQRMAHREAIVVFEGYLQNATDPNGQAFAREVLPHLKEHLAQAERLPGGS